MDGGRPTGWRPSRLAGLVLLLALAVPAQAAADTLVDVYGPDPRFGFVGLTIRGGDGRTAVTVSYRERSESYVVTDSASRIDSNCRRLSVHAVRCDVPDAPEYAELGISLNGGNDTALIRSSVVYGNSDINGGKGRDSIVGGRFDDDIRGGDAADRRSGLLNGRAGYDVLTGSRGADVLHGGRGGDILRGGEGVDVMHGMSGGDALHASDREPEPDLTCGKGDDQAVVDRRDRSPRGCEQVRTIAPGGGTK